ncbi:hypothetical protein RhiJN_23102 [Ceratobasidium sp. AG-Ba]|nr:hypothetical protein RhiJN_23102 [Ceratobasidium sp. AG-Ba]
MGRCNQGQRSKLKTLELARKARKERLEQSQNLLPDPASPTPPLSPHDHELPAFPLDDEPMDSTPLDDLGLFVDDTPEHTPELAGGCKESEQEEIDRQEALNELEAGGEESDDSDSDEDGNRLRVDNNQPLSIEECERIVCALDSIVGQAITDRGKHKGSKIDDVTLSRIRLMTASLRLHCALKLVMSPGKNPGTPSWARVP